MKPPVPRPFEPPLDKPPGTKDDGTATPKRELPKWLRWETYGQCSHDEECRPKLFAAAGVAIVALVVLAGWVGGKDKKTFDEEET